MSSDDSFENYAELQAADMEKEIILNSETWELYSNPAQSG